MLCILVVSTIEWTWVAQVNSIHKLKQLGNNDSFPFLVVLDWIYNIIKSKEHFFFAQVVQTYLSR